MPARRSRRLLQDAYRAWGGSFITRGCQSSALTWPIDVILDLHRHLQQHRLWHKTPQRIATRLIAYGDLDHRVVFILGESQRQRDGQLPLVYVKILVQASEPMQRG